MNKALLVIDAQNIYTDPNSELFCEDSENTIKRINKIIKYFESKKIPVLYVRHVHKEDGSDLGRMFDYAGPVEDFNFKENSSEVNFDKNLKMVPDSYQFIKNRYSAFIGTKLNDYLIKNKIDTLVIVGFMTNFCCESTARDAHDMDYFVDFVLDATGAPALSDEMNEEAIRKYVSEFLAAGFVRVFNTDEYIKD